MNTMVYEPRGVVRGLETAGAWLLGLLWVLPLLYAFWTAFHTAEFSTRISLSAPLTLANFIAAWHAAPFARYFLNTVLLVAMVDDLVRVLRGKPVVSHSDELKALE